MSIFINPTSLELVEMLRNELPQSVLLSGEEGIGLQTVAKYIAGENLTMILQPQNAKNKIDAESGNIAIEKIRELYEQTRSRQTKRQIIVIDGAERMSTGGQAAFLKLLEEPNRYIHFILTSHTPDRLLPTILSRVQHTRLSSITSKQTVELLNEQNIHDKTKRAQLQFIAEGLPAELLRLLADDEYFSQRAKIMTDARQLLQATAYARLLIVNQYQSDRTASIRLIESALLIARRSLSQKPQAPLLKQLERLLDIQAKLEMNHNVRLQLARCVL